RGVSPVAGVTSHPPRRFRASLFQRSPLLLFSDVAAVAADAARLAANTAKMNVFMSLSNLIEI
ncbi:hypothetical protein, partial [Sphingomonas aquatica]|uniref:hypothetical protein n=1 Tax=Sphingomonas aquatica TaxID=1763824 RepID=UPI00301C73A3